MKKSTLSGFMALILLFITSYSATAQEASASSWVVEFKQNVLWQRTTSFGILVVCTADGLHGVDPETGKILWSKAELANLPESGYQPVEGSPFVQVATAGDNPTVYVLEPFEGTLVFNSKEAGIDQVKEKHVLPKNLSILVQGISAGQDKPSLYMIDLATGKKLWQKDNEFGMLTAFKELGNNEFLLATLWSMYKINSKTGDVVWEQPLDPASAAQMEKMKALGSLLKDMAENSVKPGDVLADFYLMKGGKNFIIGFQAKQTKTSTGTDGKTVTTITYKSGYNCVALETGQPVWAEGVEFEGKKGKIIFDDRGLIVCPDAGLNTMINMVDYSTGEKKWGKKGKGFKVKGGVIDYVNTKAGILLVLAKESSSGDANYMMNMLDADAGMLKFEKYAKLKGTIQRTELLDGGLFYVTDEEADILNIGTGETMFDKSIRTGKGQNTSTDDMIYVFSAKDKGLYAIDKKAMTKALITGDDIKFDGKEEPTEIEVREEGIVISSMQNIVMVDKASGVIKFQKYYAAPDIPNIMKALNAAAAVRAAYIGVAAGITSAAVTAVTAEHASNDVEREVGTAVAGAYGDLSAAGFSYAGKYMKAINQRFKATASSADFMFMMTEGDGRKDNRLIRVSKTTGEVVDYISLGKDKDPSYEVDNIENKIYYKKEANKIHGFKFG